MGCTIIGCGKQLPALDVPNEELTKLVDTTDEWISTRTGILSRRVCVTEGNVDMAEGAARQALGWTDGGYSQRKVAPEDIDLIIYSTITPDEVVPTCAAMLRRRLGLVNAAAYDMNAACTGFIYGLTIAESMMAASAPGAVGAAGRNPIRRALVVGGERLTRVVDWTDRNTCVLFGDGAGAAVVEWDERKPGILSWYIKNDDDHTNALTCPACFDAPQPFTPEGVDPNALQQADPSIALIDAELDTTERIAAGAPRQVLHMHGQKVFKFATSAMPAAIEEVLRRANLTIDDVQFIVPASGEPAHHQVCRKTHGPAARALPGVHHAHRQLVVGMHPHDAVRCICQRQHPSRRQGGARRLRRRLHQRRRAVRGVIARQPRLFGSAGARDRRRRDHPPSPLARVRQAPPLRTRATGS